LNSMRRFAAGNKKRAEALFHFSDGERHPDRVHVRGLVLLR